MFEENGFGIIILLLGTAFLPMIAVTVTAFAKIGVIVKSGVRIPAQ